MKRSLLVAADGGPVAVGIAGANVDDTKLLAQTLDAVVVERPPPRAEQPQHRCLDNASDTPPGEAAVTQPGSVPHLRRIGEEPVDPTAGEQRFPARRWVVARTLAWRSTCRARLGRYDQHAANFRGLLPLACAVLWFRRLHRLSHLR